MLSRTSRLFRHQHLRPLSFVPVIPPTRSFSQTSSISLPTLQSRFKLLLTTPRPTTLPEPQFHHPRESAVDPLIILIAFAISAGTTYLWTRSYEDSEIIRGESLSKDATSITSSSTNMSSKIPPGRPGNLTEDQEAKLKEMWTTLFEMFGVGSDSTASAAPAAPDEKTTAQPKKSRLSVFGKKQKEDGSSTSGSESGNDKHGLNKTYNEALSQHSPEELRDSFWGMTKHDDPDGLLLRFLRARKWDVQAAVIMFISALQWRTTQMHVDDDIMLRGEETALQQSQSSDPAKKKEGDDFMSQLRMGKSFLYGHDKDGRPCCYVRVRLHRAGEQSVPSLERFTVYLIETARLELRPPVDTATIVFDMTNFSLANMDYTPVKFMIKCFEANYPESLGAVLIYKSPWIFQSIWKVIKGWLDPVVAGKVHFASGVDELSQYIPRDQIIKELDGEKDFEYEYVEPVEGENKRLEDSATREKIESERQELIKAYQKTTLSWLDSKGSDEEKEERSKIAKDLAENYWRLDPYVRARALYDRTGVISEGGKLEFYPKKS